MTVIGRGKHPNSGLYYWNGQGYHAVTSILGVLDKPLAPAAAKECARYAIANWDILAGLKPTEAEQLIKSSYRMKWNGAAQTGTDAHSAVSTLLEGGTLLHNPEIEGHLTAFGKFVADKDPTFLYNEVTVFAPKYGYAGTLDLVANINGETWLLDIKTGGVYPEAALQICAYSRAEFIGLDDKELPLPKIDKAGILKLAPSGGYELIPVRIEDDVFLAFRHIVEAFRWKKFVASTVLGTHTNNKEQ